MSLNTSQAEKKILRCLRKCDPSSLEEIQQTFPESSSTALIANALLDSFRYDQGQLSLEKVGSSIQRAANHPPELAELRAFLFQAQAYNCVHRNRLSEAEKALNALIALAEEGLAKPQQVKRWAYTTQFRISRERGDYAAEMRTLDKAIREHPHPAGNAALSWRANRLQSSMNQLDFWNTLPDLEFLSKYRRRLLRAGIMPYPVMAAYAYHAMGEYEQGQTHLNQMTEAETSAAGKSCDLIHMQLLLRLGDTESVARFIEQAKTDIRPEDSGDSKQIMAQTDLLGLQSLLAWARGDAGDLRARVDAWVKSTEKASVLERRQAQVLWIEADLLEGKFEEARAHLNEVDPSRKQGLFRPLRIRLDWLQGAKTPAVKELARLLDGAGKHKTAFARHCFQWARELSRGDLITLLSLAHSALEGTTKSPSPSSSPLPSGTEARRQKIRELFLQRTTITRRELIQEMACAPNTASRDLHALVKEGFLIFENHSAHPRTGHWTLNRASESGDQPSNQP